MQPYSRRFWAGIQYPYQYPLQPQPYPQAYQSNRTYSVIPIVGKQCTTTVKNSIRKSTKVFSTFDITFSTLTPKGFLELLINKGEHTYGTKKGNKLTVNKEYREIPYIEIHDFKSSYNQQLSN